MIPQRRQLTLGRAWDLLESLRAALEHACPILDSLCAAGETRRFEPLVSSLVLVGRAADPAAAIDAACASGIADKVLERTASSAVLV